MNIRLERLGITVVTVCLGLSVQAVKANMYLLGNVTCCLWCRRGLEWFASKFIYSLVFFAPTEASSWSCMLFQFFSIVIFTQELQCSLAQMLTVLQKDARSWSFLDSIKLLLSDARLLATVLDHSSSFGAFSFKNLNKLNIPIIWLKTIWQDCWEGFPSLHSLALMCLALPWENSQKNK